MKYNYVTFFSPGSFASESTRLDIDSWDVEAAKEMAHTIKERYGATPYGFQFQTQEDIPGETYKKTIASSPMYFLGGRVETYEMVLIRNDPNESILRDNMKYNGINRILINTNSYKSTWSLNDDDVVLEWSKR